MKRKKKNYEMGIIEVIATRKFRWDCSKRQMFERIAEKTGSSEATVRAYNRGVDMPLSFVLQLVDAYHTTHITVKYIEQLYREYMNRGKVKSRRKGMR